MRARAVLIGIVVVFLTISFLGVQAFGDEFQYPPFEIPIGGELEVTHHASGWISSQYSTSVSIQPVVENISELVHGEMSIVRTSGYMYGPYYDSDIDCYWYYASTEIVTLYECAEEGGDLFSFSVWKQEGGEVDVENPYISFITYEKIYEIFYQILNKSITDLDVDGNRNGYVEVDDAGEEALDKKNPIKFYNPKEGALVVVNNDDDDNDHECDNEDNSPNGDNDKQQMTPMVLRLNLKIPFGPNKFTLKIKNNKEAIRVFRNNSEILGPDKEEYLVGIGDNKIDWRREFLIEGLEYAKQVTIQLLEHPFNGPDAQGLPTWGAPNELDSVNIKTAPYLLISNLPKTEILYGSTTSATGWTDELITEFTNLGFTQVAGSYVGVTDSSTEFVQDNFEMGYTRRFMNTPHLLCPLNQEQLDNKFHVCLQTPGGSDFQSGLVAAEMGYFAPENWSQGPDDGGNIECSPPITNKPFGIGIFGNNLQSNAENFFKEQKEQTKDGTNLLKISVNWLRVQHVDCVVVIAPSGNDWVIYIGDLNMMIALLTAQKGEDEDYVIFSGGSNRTVTAILDDFTNNQNHVTTINTALTTVYNELKAVFGVGRIKKIPVMYSPHASGHVVTWVPNAVNLQVVDNNLIVPAPNWGKLRDKLTAVMTGATLKFVDTYRANERGGNAHCLTNTKRKITEPGKAR